MSYLDSLNQKKAEQSDQKHKAESLKAFESLSGEIRTLLSSLEKTGSKTLDKDFVSAVKGLEKVASSLSDIKVTSDNDIKDAIRGLAYAFANLDLKPQVNVAPAKVEVNERPIDFKPVIDAIKKLDKKAPEVKIDLEKLSDSMASVKKAIEDQSFPVANFVLPFKDASKSTQALVDSDGHVQVDVLSAPAVTIDTTGLATTAKQDTIIGHLDGVEGLLTTIDADTSVLAGVSYATSTKQSDGSQKTQIVDAGGEAATVTGGKLDVNATATLAGTAIPISGATEAVGVAIVDGSGNQITSFGGGTQYTEGDTDASVTGTAVMWEDTSDTMRVASAAKPLPVGGTVTANAGTGNFNVNLQDGSGNDITSTTSKLDVNMHVGGSSLGSLSLNSDDLSPVTSLGSAAYNLVYDGATWDRVRGNSTDGMLVNLGANNDVTNTGTFAVQVDGAALTALQLIDDIVYTDDTSTHATGTSKGALFMAAATPTDTSVSANDIGAVAMTTDRKLHVSVQDSLPAGTAAIGKLAANSGVDIGDVDVLSVIPGTGATNLGKAEDAQHTSGDVGVMSLGVRTDAQAALATTTADYIPMTTDSVGAQYVTMSASTGAIGASMYFNAGLTSTKVAVNASGGNLYGYHFYNAGTAVAYVQFFNVASASVTVGTTTPNMVIAIPPGGWADSPTTAPGIGFGTALTIAATTTSTGSGNPATAPMVSLWYK